MNGKKPIWRGTGTLTISLLPLLIGMGMGMGMGMVTPAGDTPIQPSVQQVLQQALQPAVPYVAAWAGWNGPAIDPQRKPRDMEGFNTTKILRDAELARARRAILLQVATPDPKVLLGFGAIILLLRRMRALREEREHAGPHIQSKA